jgi:DME family drug/metabolite transporter
MVYPSSITRFRTEATTGIALVMVAAALWATVGFAVEATPQAERLSDTALAAARTGIAGPTLLVVWRIAFGGRLVVLRSLALRPLAVFALASAVFQICLFRCFDQLGVTVAVFLTVCLPPVLGSAWTAFRGEGGLSPKALLALALALAGVALVSLAGQGPGRGDPSIAGLANGLLASIAFVAMSLAAAEMSRNSPAILVAGAGLALSSVLLIALVLASGNVEVQVGLSGAGTNATLVLILYLGLLPTALAYLCYCSGMARCRTPAVGLVASMIEPVLAALLAVFLMGERISPTTAAGCALLMGAMLLLWQSER